MIARVGFYLLSVLLTGAPDSRLTGWIADGSGNNLPGVTISVWQEGHGPVRITVSNADGRFSLGRLEPGEYQVTAALNGFKTEQRTASVRQGREASVTVLLELAKPTQDVTVCCCFPLLDVESEKRVHQFRLRITDATGHSLPHATVEVSGDKSLKLIADARGFVEFAGTGQDFKSLLVAHEGFRSLSTLLCCVGEKGQVILRPNTDADAGTP